ncbi:MAG: hypothetical protein ACM3TN_19055 [Alphaproteobacteria bacterium]|jgi:hypothetical protein
MNPHDWELLDKQLYGFSSRPPQNSGVVGLVVVAMFLAGMAVGGVLFTRDSQHKQIASQDAGTVISFLNGVSPTLR